MRDSYTRSYRYQLTNPPQALLKAKMDNIAIVPASMLPLTEIVKEQVNTLPKGGVFLCYAQENTKQRKILERVEETFREHGHAVRSMSVGEVYKSTPNRVLLAIFPFRGQSQNFPLCGRRGNRGRYEMPKDQSVVRPKNWTPLQ